MVEFVSYNGAYPNLCSGELVVRINGKIVNLGRCLTSGGCCTFSNGWEEEIEKGDWLVDVPAEYMMYELQIIKVVNENVSRGCCGGCI